MKKFIFIVLTLIFIPLPIYASDSNEAIIEETEVFYMDLQDAIANAKSGDTITLTSNVTLTEKLTIPANTTLTINLNNKTLSVADISDNYGLVIKGNLTIEGNGTVNTSGLYGLGVSTTGSLTIKGGTYYNTTGHYLIGNWNNTTIEGGTFYGNYCVVNGFQGNTVQVTGGTFNNNEETIVLGNVSVSGGSFNQNVEEYLKEGSTITKKDNIYYVSNTEQTFKENTEEKQPKSSNKTPYILLSIILIPIIIFLPKIFKTIKQKFI